MGEENKMNGLVNCIGCGTAFIPKNKKNVYCTEKCRRKIYQKGKQGIWFKNWYKEKGLMQRYGISSKEYHGMIEKQNGVCFICGKSPAHGKALHVDHNHKTGKVRKLLCNRCNLAIGSIENETILKKMVEYLKNNQ